MNMSIFLKSYIRSYIQSHILNTGGGMSILFFFSYYVLNLQIIIYNNMNERE